MMKNIFEKLNQIVCNHNYKKIRLHFYCVDEYPKFIKLWQILYKCNICDKTIKPKWFSLKWRLKHKFAIFSDEDLKLNLTDKEINEYKFTTKILKILDKKEGVI